MNRNKKMVKSLFCGVLAMGTVLSATVVPYVGPVNVLAADSVITANESTLTINETVNGTATTGSQFSLYRVMDLAADGTFTVNANFADELQGVTADKLGTFSSTEIEALTAKLQDKAKTLTADYTVEANKKSDPLTNGYYLAVETATTESDILTSAPFLVSLPSTNVGGTEWNYDVAVDTKTMRIGVEKQIKGAKGAKDSTVAYDGVKDTVAVGDTISYELKTTVPAYTKAYFADGKAPVFKIKDTMTAGLTFKRDTLKVTVDGVDYSDAIDVTEAEGNVEVAFPRNLLTLSTVQGKDVVVTFNAEVNDKATMGTTANEAKASIEFNKTVDTVETKESDATDVYSFGVEVTQFTKEAGDAAGTALRDAEFTLYKDEACAEAVGTATTDENGKLQFNLIDAGDYWLKEVKSPSGYTLLTKPVKISLVPELDADNKVLSGSLAKVLVNDTEVTGADTGAFDTYVDATAGVIHVGIENHKGFTLPATGGAGIYLLVTFGLAGAMTLTVVAMKKRKED